MAQSFLESVWRKQQMNKKEKLYFTQMGSLNLECMIKCSRVGTRIILHSWRVTLGDFLVSGLAKLCTNGWERELKNNRDWGRIWEGRQASGEEALGRLCQPTEPKLTAGSSSSAPGPPLLTPGEWGAHVIWAPSTPSGCTDPALPDMWTTKVSNSFLPQELEECPWWLPRDPWEPRERQMCT